MCKTSNKIKIKSTQNQGEKYSQNISFPISNGNFVGKSLVVFQKMLLSEMLRSCRTGTNMIAFCVFPPVLRMLLAGRNQYCNEKRCRYSHRVYLCVNFQLKQMNEVTTQTNFSTSISVVMMMKITLRVIVVFVMKMILIVAIITAVTLVIVVIIILSFFINSKNDSNNKNNNLITTTMMY